MSWTCPNEIKDGFCGLRKKKCEPSSDGCVLSNEFKFIELDEHKPESDKTKGKRNKKRGR
ncbi:hypothetical protein ACFL0P_01530 [Candidatus Omnitrophota bacterium]